MNSIVKSKPKIKLDISPDSNCLKQKSVDFHF